MRTNAAVLYESGIHPPYAERRPLVIEELELEGPGPLEALVRVVGAGLCHSDMAVIEGVRRLPLPIVLGHECAGIVEEVGEGVVSVKKGDHVVLSYVPSCGRCYYCAVGRPTLCDPGRDANRRGVLLTNARRFRKGGEYLYHHLGVSAFSEWTVVSENSLIPIRREVPLEKAPLFGCAVMTGIGAVVNTARVEAGSRVAVFGCGGVGLNIIQGAALAGAYQIIAVDVLESKLETARRMGATDTVDASKTDPVAEVKRLTGGLGADYTFEATGNTRVMAQAFMSAKKTGKTVIVGITSPEDRLEIPSSPIVDEERVVMGAYTGSSVPRRDIPRLVDLYLSGRLKIEEVVSRYLTLDQVNEGFDSLARGEVARQIIRF